MGNSKSCDIDIATDATPDEITQIFPDHVLVGKEFGVVLVIYEEYQFEIATFRQDILYENGRKPAQISLKSTPEEDAERRDFTINGLFFDPITEIIYDFVNGKADIEKKLIRTIGNPEERFQEDRSRMLRAVRFSYRFGFTIEEYTYKAICKLSHTLLPAVSMERIWQELCKMREGQRFKEALLKMHQLGLLGTIFPPLHTVSLETISQRIHGIEQLSTRVPTILLVATLFTQEDENFIRNLYSYLRAPRKDGKWVEFFLLLQNTDLRSLDRYHIAKMVANSHFEICFEVMTTRLPQEARQKWQEWHLEILHDLTFYIHRLRKKEPLVIAQDLQEQGIAAGPEMGILLERAWEIAINHNLKEKALILKKLGVL